MQSMGVMSFVVNVGLVLVMLVIDVRCHVIGGGLNTDFSVKETKNLLTALSDVSVTDLLLWEMTQDHRKISQEPYRPQHKKRIHRKKKKPTAFGKHRGGNNDLSDAVNSRMYAGHIFNSGDSITHLSNMWRRKREVQCSLPRSLYKQFRHLNAHHDVTDIVRFSESENSHVPSTEIVRCGKEMKDSNDEYIVRRTERDLGPEYYPRYIRDLHCLQIDSSRQSQAIHLEVTVFRQVSCDNGKAVMKAVKILVTAGCSCDHPTTPQPTTTA